MLRSLSRPFWRPLLGSLMLAGALAAAVVPSARAQDAAGGPATQPAAAATAPVALPDPQGYNGGATEPLFTPNSYLSGWATGVGEDDGSGGLKSWKQYADPDKPTVQELSKNVAKAFYSINFVWVLVAGFLVMFMQAGFALVETGLCRAKNAAHTMWMNFMVYPLGMFGFFVCGFMFLSSGANATAVGAPGPLGGLLNSIGTDHMFKIGDWGLFGTDTGFLFLGKHAYDGAAMVLFLFMMVFMDTTATIPTGALAERWASKHFILFSICIGAFIYPIYGSWVWGGGWLAQLGVLKGLGHGFVDYAGSSVVHLQGGALALVTSIILGPRIGKYKNGVAQAIPGHHVPMVLLGTFILAFGWFGFNAGSSLAGTDGRIGVTAVNTMIAGTGGAMAIAIVGLWVTGKFDPTMACNGMLAGLVAITAPCAFVAPWAAFTIGALAGGICYGSVWFFENVTKIDDPVGAISVHGVCGAFGVLCVGIFADGTYGAGWNGVGYMAYSHATLPPDQAVSTAGVTGLLYGDTGQFFAQCVGVVACTLWNVVVGGIVYLIIGLITPKRVPAKVEIAGLDLEETGIAGYPSFMTHTYADQISDADVAMATGVPATLR